MTCPTCVSAQCDTLSRDVTHVGVGQRGGKVTARIVANRQYVAHGTYVHATRPHSAALLIGYFERLAFPAHARASSSCTRLVCSF
eukprot:COSAG01_NODE_41733_length_447_cov_96.017241_2_plen_84_part_01